MDHINFRYDYEDHYYGVDLRSPVPAYLHRDLREEPTEVHGLSSPLEWFCSEVYAPFEEYVGSRRKEWPITVIYFVFLDTLVLVSFIFLFVLGGGMNDDMIG